MFTRPVFPFACGRWMEQRPLGLSPELRTPPLPATHVRLGTGHRAQARATPSTCRPPIDVSTQLVRPRVAPTSVNMLGWHRRRFAHSFALPHNSHVPARYRSSSSPGTQRWRTVSTRWHRLTLGEAVTADRRRKVEHRRSGDDCGGARLRVIDAPGVASCR